MELVVTSVAVLRLIRLGEAGVERRGFDLYVKARKDEGQTGESAFGYRRGKEKSLGEGKASIAGFCESAFTRGAGAHLDVGGGLLLDLGNGLFDLNLKIGRGTGRLGRPSRASFLLVQPAQQTRLVKTKSIPGGEDIALQNVPPGRAQPRLPRIAK